MKKGVYLSYQEVKEFVHKLGLKNQNEWREYCKSKNKPDNIPANPRGVYKNNGWISMGDFLGTGYVNNSERIYLSYKELKEIIHKLNLKSKTEWYDYCKSGDKPNNIPSNVNSVYKNKGWVDWGDFLGTGTIAPQKKEWVTYQEAKEFVSKLNLKNKEEWKEYVKSGNKPDNIPANPQGSYVNKSWISWGEFLGTGIIASYNRKYLSYEETKEFISKFSFKNRNEFNEYCKSKNKPDNIITTPDRAYKNKGWISWGEFLGTGYIANRNRKYLTYEEAKEFVMKLNLKSQTEWKEYAKSGNKLDNMPMHPNEVYENEGWKGWAHFLGYLGNGNVWNKNNIIAFLEENKEYLHTCSVPELLTIIESNGLYNYLTNEKIRRLQETKECSNEREQEVDEIINSVKEKTEEEFESNETELDDEIKEEENIILKKEEQEIILTPQEQTQDITIQESTDNEIRYLKALENESITASLDDERVEFLITNKINNLWYKILNKKLNIDTIRNHQTNNDYPTRIKETFLDEYDIVFNLDIPNDFIYDKEPLLMQKLIAYRLSVHKRYGNWSGVGAGKTIGAILAGHYINAKNTLIITFNSTIGHEDQRGWLNEIKLSTNNYKIYTKFDNYIKLDNNHNNYLVLNYETFQQNNSANYVIDLLENNIFDYIILDEVQSIKQRDNNDILSKRREVILGLISKIKELNPNYYLLAMSATPVINNLIEAKSLIELIKMEVLDDVQTRASIPNCIEMYRRLTNIGIRHKNIEDNILKNNKHTLIQIQANELFEEANQIPYDNTLEKEKLTIYNKLDAIKPFINTSNGKTIIYTHYVDGLDNIIHDYLSNLGFKVGVYTGNIISKKLRDDVLSDFINDKYDILLGSRPISTGVNGLQKISDRIIILSLPWTNAELEQLIGRVNRKGSLFKEVDVIIPLVEITNNDKIFNWDKNKYDLVTYKATIANAAVDGIIPDKLIPSKDKLLIDANDKLNEWLERLKQGDVLTVDRKELIVNLFPDITDENKRIIRINSELQEFNRLGKVTSSHNLNKKFNDNPSSWFNYHKLRREAMKDWNEIPYEVIAKKIKNKNHIVVDFGCGDNQMKKLIPNNKVISFDHIAFDDSVIPCDMADLSPYLENESVDVAVFSLSLWSPNYKDYINEAYRVLNFGGFIHIAEPLNNYQTNEEKNQLIKLITDVGFNITINPIHYSDKFIYISGIKL
jgi:superfamily II DNA or RNA helicase